MINAKGEVRVCRGVIKGSSFSLGNQLLAARNRDACIESLQKEGFINTEDLGCYPEIIDIKNNEPLIKDQFKKELNLAENRPATLLSVNGKAIDSMDSYKNALFGEAGKELKFIINQDNAEYKVSKTLQDCPIK